MNIVWKIDEKVAVNKIIMLFRSVEDNKGLFVFELSAVSYIETVFTGITQCNIVEGKQFHWTLALYSCYVKFDSHRFYQIINYLLKPDCKSKNPVIV